MERKVQFYLGVLQAVAAETEAQPESQLPAPSKAGVLEACQVMRRQLSEAHAKYDVCLPTAQQNKITRTGIAFEVCGV